ncbi:MAG: hypothetical protein MHMPM18_000211 [Marteilia pararefringens]
MILEPLGKKIELSREFIVTEIGDVAKGFNREFSLSITNRLPNQKIQVEVNSNIQELIIWKRSAKVAPGIKEKFKFSLSIARLLEFIEISKQKLSIQFKIRDHGIKEVPFYFVNFVMKPSESIFMKIEGLNDKQDLLRLQNKSEDKVKLLIVKNKNSKFENICNSEIFIEPRDSVCLKIDKISKTDLGNLCGFVLNNSSKIDTYFLVNRLITDGDNIGIYDGKVDEHCLVTLDKDIIEFPVNKAVKKLKINRIQTNCINIKNIYKDTINIRFDLKEIVEKIGVGMNELVLSENSQLISPNQHHQFEFTFKPKKEYDIEEFIEFYIEYNADKICKRKLLFNLKSIGHEIEFKEIHEYREPFIIGFEKKLKIQAMNNSSDNSSIKLLSIKDNQDKILELNDYELHGLFFEEFEYNVQGRRLIEIPIKFIPKVIGRFSYEIQMNLNNTDEIVSSLLKGKIRNVALDVDCDHMITIPIQKTIEKSIKISNMENFRLDNIKVGLSSHWLLVEKKYFPSERTFSLEKNEVKIFKYLLRAENLQNTENMKVTATCMDQLVAQKTITVGIAEPILKFDVKNLNFGQIKSGEWFRYSIEILNTEDVPVFLDSKVEDDPENTWHLPSGKKLMHYKIRFPKTKVRVEPNSKTNFEIQIKPLDFVPYHGKLLLATKAGKIYEINFKYQVEIGKIDIIYSHSGDQNSIYMNKWNEREIVVKNHSLAYQVVSVNITTDNKDSAIVIENKLNIVTIKPGSQRIIRFSIISLCPGDIAVNISAENLGRNESFPKVDKILKFKCTMRGVYFGLIDDSDKSENYNKSNNNDHSTIENREYIDNSKCQYFPRQLEEYRIKCINIDNNASPVLCMSFFYDLKQAHQRFEEIKLLKIDKKPICNFK